MLGILKDDEGGPDGCAFLSYYLLISYTNFFFDIFR